MRSKHTLTTQFNNSVILGYLLMRNKTCPHKDVDINAHNNQNVHQQVKVTDYVTIKRNITNKKDQTDT